MGMSASHHASHASHALLRTHARAERPGSVVLPAAERVFNPSRETRSILNQAKAIGPYAAQLCERLFALEGRVGQRKLWGIVNLAKRYPKRLVDDACAAALDAGVHSYRQVKTLTEQRVAEALATLEAAASDAAPSPLTQDHTLIRDTEEYGDLFAQIASVTATTPTLESHQP